MSSECDQKANSPLPYFEYSEADIVGNSDVKTEESVDKIKQEPIDNLHNTQNIQGIFELSPPVEFKTEQSDKSTAELEAEEKIEIEGPADYKNLLQTPLKTETDSTNSQKESQRKTPKLKTQNTIKTPLFRCGHCNYSAKLIGNLRRHINGIHLKVQPYKCDICNFQCVQKIHLKHHKSSHFRKCRYCNYIGIDQEALTAHRIANHSMYKCRFCDYTTKRKEHVKTHENAKHLKKEKYTCTECSYTTLYKSSIKIHKKLMHKQLDFKYFCDKCDFKSKMERGLREHTNTIHTRSKLFYCAHCDYTSTFKLRLAVHLRNNHALTAVFKCEQCPKAFKERNELIRHDKAKHKKYRFECYDCGFLAICKLKLKCHILFKHLKQRSFQCKFCTYAAFGKGHLLVHAKARHKEAFIETKSIKDEFVFWKKLSL